uniref:Deubiquitinating enzyme MINDY-3/4 conserved domain-containing protein n=1 Tax=Vitis vinifera TaxID=29760 RepID=A5BRA2_VITVI|nr:hypothetical protein VITISV_014961 [Vitis vinifera]
MILLGIMKFDLFSTFECKNSFTLRTSAQCSRSDACGHTLISKSCDDGNMIVSFLKLESMGPNMEDNRKSKMSTSLNLTVKLRFSPDPETFMGLVQHEGGPCGVLAAIQAFVLKYLIFFPDDLGKVEPNMPENVDSRRFSKSESVTSNMFSSLTEDGKARGRRSGHMDEYDDFEQKDDQRGKNESSGVLTGKWSCNKAGRFLLCSVLSLKDKSFSLVFLEGRDSLRGWKTLASKLREIGVVPKFRKVESSKKVVHLLVDSGGGEAPPKGKSFAEVLSRGKRVLGETVCVQGESDEGKEMQLDWWRPDVGCLRVEDCVKEVWEGPRRLHVVARVEVFEIQLWWEIAPWFLIIVSMGRGKDPEVGDEGEDLSCTSGRMESEEEKCADEGLQVPFEGPTLPAHAAVESVLSGHGGCSIVGAVEKVSSESLDMAVRTMGLLSKLGSKVRETLLWWESCPPPSSSLVSKARRLDDGFRFSNQLVVEGCGWDKIAQLKEGHPAGALGEGSHPLKTMLKDGYLLEFPQNFEAGSLCKDIIASCEESDSSKIMSSSCFMGEAFPLENLFDKLTKFNSFLGMLVMGFKNRDHFLAKEDGHKERE